MDQQFVIDIEGGQDRRVTPAAGNEQWLMALAGERADGAQLRLQPAEEGDVEGHLTASQVAVLAYLDEDDTEGHAISIHFPTANDADLFRRRLLLAGVLVGSVAIAGATGAGLASQGQSDSGAATSGAALTQAGAASADRDLGVMDITPAAIGGVTSGAAAADRDLGVMDITPAAGTGGAAAGAAAADRDLGVMDISPAAGTDTENEDAEGTGLQPR